MIKVENIDVWGFEHAVRGCRNPMNSWNKSDSICGINCDECTIKGCENCKVLNGIGNIIGKNDLGLMQRLYKAGTEHRKYLRQIFVSMDITSALYWWKEFDTYKVGTVANSCSTMHKIAAKEFELDDFSHEHLIDETVNAYYKQDEYNCCLSGISAYDWINETIGVLNAYREKYLETKDKKYWWQMIQLLPSSYNQKRTVTMNYENVVTIIKQRTGHKLDEWNKFVKILKSLPYVKEIIGDDK